MAELTWALVKHNNCFLVKRSNTRPFTKDPQSLTGLHQARDSGLTNSKSVGINFSADKKGAVLSLATVCIFFLFRFRYYDM